MSATLFIFTRQKAGLADTLSAFARVIGDNSAIAILYSPEDCQLAKLAEGSLWGADGRQVDIGSTFEARAFCEIAELRWVKDAKPEQCHRAAILTERDLSEKLRDWETEKRDDIIATLNQTYLLWGEGTGRNVSPGWNELATARIGALPVPVVSVGKNHRVSLTSVEYVIESEFGNAIILDERFIKLEVVRA